MLKEKAQRFTKKAQNISAGAVRHGFMHFLLKKKIQWVSDSMKIKIRRSEQICETKALHLLPTML